MTTAAEIASALRAIAPDKQLMTDEVPLIDQIAARWDARTVRPAPITGRRTSAKGIALIHSFESCKLKAYPDPGTGGKPYTIGWGSTTDENGRPIDPKAEWTQARADARFALDLARFEKGVSDLLGTAPTTQGQYDALVSFAYNIGYGDGGLKTSTLLRKHKAGDYAGAKAEFARWNKAAGKVMNGLTRRRAAEAELYES